MNSDTPGAVPSDDFPFLGPAVSPRRRDAGASAAPAGDLPGPFVGGMFRSHAGEETREPVEREADDAYDAPRGEDSGGGIEEYTAAEWPADDFPWLTPSEPEKEPEPAANDEPWRATAEVEELAPEADRFTVEQQTSVQHFSWIGEPLPELAEEPREPQAAEPREEGGAGADASPEWRDAEVRDVEDFGWEGGPGLSEAGTGLDSAEEDVAHDERVGFSVDSEDAEGSWTTAPEWNAIAPPELPAEAGVAPEDAASASAVPAWDDAPVEAAPATEADRWSAGENFRVEDEGAGGEDLVAAGVRADEPPVEAVPLPVDQWEASPADAGVEEEQPAVEVQGVQAEDALGEVADRLERIARSLRSGRPVEALEQGDPLQLLITGYALGLSQARKERRD